MMTLKEFFYWIFTVVSGKPVDMDGPDPVDLQSMTKKELVAYGESVGVELKMSQTKTQMIEELS